MHKGQYDNDITVWSPEGRIHQIEYSMEAVKMGGASVGIKSKTHSVICALQKSASELSSYQKKIFEIDDHIGVSVSGISADARVLCKFMRNECLNHRYVYDSSILAQRLVNKVSDKSQTNTQRYGSRPYGVGMLIASYDKNGSHIYETCPSGNYYDWKAQSIGNRPQSAKTYLEKHYESFVDASRDELICHALRALRETLIVNPTYEQKKDKEPTSLTIRNCAVGIVGKDEKFHILTPEEVGRYLESIESGHAEPMSL